MSRAPTPAHRRAQARMEARADLTLEAAMEFARLVAETPMSLETLRANALTIALTDVVDAAERAETTEAGIDEAFVMIFASMIMRGACPAHYVTRAADLANLARDLALKLTAIAEAAPADDAPFTPAVPGDFPTRGEA